MDTKGATSGICVCILEKNPERALGIGLQGEDFAHPPRMVGQHIAALHHCTGPLAPIFIIQALCVP